MARKFVNDAGVNKLVMRFTAASRQTEFQTVSTLDEIGKDLLGKSKEVTPKDEEDLRDSGYAGVFQGPEGPMLEVGYQTDYALRLHEELFENYTTPGTGPKYLERPFLENQSRYREMLMDAARRPLRG